MRVRWSSAVAAALAVTILLGGCGRDASDRDLPDGVALLADSADAMENVTTLRFALSVEGGQPSGFQIVDADGVITAEGDVSATAQVHQAGQLVEYEYLVVGGIPYLKGPTGGFREVPPAVYGLLFNPSALLSGERSLGSALRAITEARTEDEESVGGVDTYRIKGNLNPRLVEGMALLASGAAGEATIWVDRDTGELIRARMPFTMPGETEETVVTVTLSDFNDPVEIEAPV